MLDHADRWNAAPDWATARLTGKNVAIRNIALPEQALISGDLAAFAGAAGMDATGVGAFGRTEGEVYTVRLARDRLLAVGALYEGIREGWNEAGFAVTATSGADHVFELSGDGLSDLLARATTCDPTGSSPSAAIGFAAVPAVAYRHGDALRVHVERGLAVYVWTWLDTVLKEQSIVKAERRTQRAL